MDSVIRGAVAARRETGAELPFMEMMKADNRKGRAQRSITDFATGEYDRSGRGHDSVSSLSSSRRQWRHITPNFSSCRRNLYDEPPDGSYVEETQDGRQYQSPRHKIRRRAAESPTISGSDEDEIC